MLIQKDKTKRNIVSNDRPITRLPLVWMLLTGILTNEIYDYKKKKLFPEEEKGCRRKCNGTVDFLFIDKMILQELQM